MIAALLLAVDFNNFTYAMNPCRKNVPVPVAMQRGAFDYYDKDMGAGYDLHIASVTRGSLKRGADQAVVVIACDFPVGGTAEAYAFDDRGRTARFLGTVGNANWGPDWGAGPDSIHVRFKGPFLYLRYCKDNDCAAELTDTYALRGPKLVRIYRMTAKAKR